MAGTDILCWSDQAHFTPDRNGDFAAPRLDIRVKGSIIPGVEQLPYGKAEGHKGCFTLQLAG